MKTKAGMNRIVPIHEKIKGLVKNKYDEALKLWNINAVNCIKIIGVVNYFYSNSTVILHYFYIDTPTLKQTPSPKNKSAC